MNLSGRFNSLQTGKCIQRVRKFESCEVRKVSIPFKRESVSKGIVKKFISLLILQFQFPSNGKCIQSIVDSNLIGLGSLFQFPSNGKVYPKADRVCIKHLG